MIREFECMEDLQDAYDNLEWEYDKLEDENTELNSKLALAAEAITPLITTWTVYKLNNSVDPKNMDVKELDLLFDKLRELE